MLPDSKAITSEGTVNRMKFADTAIVDMMNKMISMGASQQKLTARIAGGAVMFETQNNKFNIGERNINAVRKALTELKIPIIAQDVGENYGRTVFFYSQDGRVEIKSTVKGIRQL
jgi:chemotaxis protein CheD